MIQLLAIYFYASYNFRNIYYQVNQKVLADYMQFGFRTPGDINKACTGEVFNLQIFKTYTFFFSTKIYKCVCNPAEVAEMRGCNIMLFQGKK